MSFEDYVQQNGMKILPRRIQGATLTEIALEDNVSIETVRLWEMAEIAKIPEDVVFDEEIYKDFVLHAANANVFFKVECRVNALFKSALYLYNKTTDKEEISKKVPVKELLKGGKYEEYPDDFLERVTDFFMLVIWDDGKVTGSYGQECYNYAAKEVEEFRGPELIGKAQEYVKYGKLRELKSKTTEALTSCENIIRTGPHAQMRYYHHQEKTIRPVLENLRLPSDSRCTTNRMYMMNKKDLNRIGIRNGYELHSLFRKHDIKGMQLGKCPRVYVDKDLYNAGRDNLDSVQ